jgi:hypothetical protein
LIGYGLRVAFPQYRISIRRPKEEWADALDRICSRFPGSSVHTLPGWRQVAGSDIAAAAEEVRDFTIECLREMAEEGDPFSQTLLEDRQIRYSGAFFEES